MKLRSETREVRPFESGLLQSALSGVKLYVGNRSVDPDGRLVLSTQSYLQDPITLRFGETRAATNRVRLAIEEGIAESNLEPSQVDLVLLLTSRRMQLSDVAWRRPASEMNKLGNDVPVERSDTTTRALASPFGGCTGQLLVVLNQQLEPEPRKPWRKGTWLARTIFKVATELGEIGFTPMKLTDEIRDRYRLPANTLRYIRAENVLGADPGADSIELFVDEEFLSALAQAPYTPGARTFQKQLFLDAMRAVLHQASADLRCSPGLALEDIEDSIVWKLLRRSIFAQPDEAVDAARDQMEFLLGRLRDEPEYVVALVENWIPELRKNYYAVLTEGA